MKKHPLLNAKKGEVYSVFLNQKSFCYVRIFRGSSLGVIPVITEALLSEFSPLRSVPPKWFFIYMAPNEDPTDMVRIGEYPLEGPDDAWPPPCYWPPSIIHSDYIIEHQGMRRSATKEETIGMSRCTRITPAELRNFIISKRDECTKLKVP
jgi:hypothetical protein